uniref:Large ribosomal subunit protein uL22c n=1 Tax=Pleurostichidium falkenbergii TaxID=121064 RepID=A0A4D6UWX8_9FLOR|nr:ribosomal protein L22 [Pleurostichidium falkenbergii]QCH39699.1 ribosomal protein L22 [Pleurostichidium falkenbergii]
MNNIKIQSKAETKYTRISQYKSSRVLKQIQGKSYSEARLILEFMPYKACGVVIKTLDSALNNIKQKTKTEISKQKVHIVEACANKGPVLKRFKPRAQGRAFPIRKPTCHIIIKLEM